MKLPRDRFDYSPIVARPPWSLPKGARIAVLTANGRSLPALMCAIEEDKGSNITWT